MPPIIDWNKLYIKFDKDNTSPIGDSSRSAALIVEHKDASSSVVLSSIKVLCHFCILLICAEPHRSGRFRELKSGNYWST